MNLSTRLTLAMVSLVLVTVAAVSWLSYRNLESTIIPVETMRVETRTRLTAGTFDSKVGFARADILAALGLSSLQGYVRAHENGGRDPQDGTSEELWRQRLEQNFTAQLGAKPQYDQFRLIGVGNNGHEMVRVDRSGANGAVRVRPLSELAEKGDRPYFKDTLNVPKGEVYVSRIALNQEHGAIEVPHKPTIRIGTPVYDADGKLFGILIINIDLRPTLAEMRRSPNMGAAIFMINDRGEYLLHPDSAREFGDELGHSYTLQGDYPSLAPLVGGLYAASRIFRDSHGERNIVSVVPVRMSGGPLISVVQMLPVNVALASMAGVRRAAFLAGLCAVLVAGLLAWALSRSMTQPLSQMTGALQKFTGEEDLELPTGAQGEIGLLARAFDQMRRAVSDRTRALRHEIEERKRAEQRVRILAERERIGASAVKFANDAVLTCGVDGIITSWNPAAERMFGYSADEAIGRSVAIMAPPEKHGEQLANLHHVLNGGTINDLEASRSAKDGHALELSYNMAPLYGDDGEITGVSVIARDINEKKVRERELAHQSDELRRSNADLEQFAYVASHDLQEPLRMVASYTELLAERYEGRLDDRADKYIHYAVDGAKRMQRLVNDLLAYSRIGRGEHELVPVDADRVLRDVLHNFSGKIETSGAQIEIGPLPKVQSDPLQLGQVFQNLIGNALKFSANKPARIRISAERDHGLWRFAVADNGIGIDRQYGDRIFQMFQRLNARDEYEGNGIGLTISRKIVERQGGRIWFDSTPGEGTTFYFTLADAQEKAHDEHHPDLARRGQSG